MDLHFHGPEPTAAERAAVDSVLGPPTSAWAGGRTDVEAEGHRTLLGGHAAAIAPRPAPARAPRRPGRGSAGSAGRPRLHLPAPDRAARRGLRRRHLLPSLLARRRDPPAVAHVCDDIACRIQGGGALCASWSDVGLGRRQGDGAAGSAARAWASASRRRPRWSLSAGESPHVRSRWPRATRREHRGRARLARARRPTTAARLAPAIRAPGRRRRRSACSAGSAGSIPRASTPIAASGGYAALARGDRDRARRASSREVTAPRS